ncbi:hypothetical protein [Leifsonia poae]|uniref:hypothetical protein n=1 Tax=Leifsonia poae TaxID=110933 RepID=UPI001CBF4563|nr:hypothetical protein [Leifsonia poae]
MPTSHAPLRSRRTYLPAAPVEGLETEPEGRQRTGRAALRELRGRRSASHVAAVVPPRAPRSGRRRWGFRAVLFFVVTGLVGTAALPAYASSDTGSANGDQRVALAVQTLTGGSASAAVPAATRDDYSVVESSSSLDSTLNTVVSPTVQALATKLMAAVAAGRLVGSTPNHIPEIANLAAGRAVPGCGVDYRVLQAIDIALQNFGQVGVSDINRLCTGQIEGAGVDSAHYTDGGGHAVDFYLLDGQALTGGDAQSVKLIRALDPLVPSGAGLGQVGCRASISLQNFVPFDDTCNHLHIDFLNAKGASLKD